MLVKMPRKFQTKVGPAASPNYSILGAQKLQVLWIQCGLSKVIQPHSVRLYNSLPKTGQQILMCITNNTRAVQQNLMPEQMLTIELCALYQLHTF